MVGVRLDVFGGLRAERGTGPDASEADLGPVRVRLLLAGLLLGRGQVVRAHDLIDLIWREEQPATAANQLHRLVGGARAALEADRAPRTQGLLTRVEPEGYALRVESDLFDYDASAELARRASASRHWEEAIEHYQHALELSAATPFAGLETYLSSYPPFEALQAMRLELAADALEAAIRADNPAPIALLAAPLAALAPLHERLQAQLIRALGHAGRRADALAHFAWVRAQLREELGVEPAAALQEAHREVLHLDDPEAEFPVHRVTPPAQLPPTPYPLIDRADVRDVLDDLLNVDGARARLAVITGMGGVGKTTEALAWAHAVSHAFPDGQLYLNLRGFDAEQSAVSPMEALSMLMASLGAVRRDTEETLDERSARWRTMVADQRLLVMLDNARDSEQVRPLLPAAAGSLTLVTSRDRMAPLIVTAGATSVPIARLDTSDSVDLLAARLGSRRLAGHSQEVDAIVAACGGLPLALAVLSARIVTSPSLTLTHVVQELGPPHDGEPGGLAAAAGDQAVGDLRSVFTASYTPLEEDAAFLLRVMALHPGTEASAASLASMAGLPRFRVRALVTLLVSANLAEEPTRDRFTLHDLVRGFALERVTAEERLACELRLIDHVARTMWHCYSLFETPLSVADPPDPSVEPEVPTDVEAAFAWYERERQAIYATLRRACELGRHRAAVRIALDWRPMNERLDSMFDSQPLMDMAARSADALGDRVLIAEMSRALAPRAYVLGDPPAALAHLDKALALFTELEVAAGQANTLRNLSRVAELSGRREESVALSEEALRLARSSGDQMVVLNTLTEHAGQLTLAARWEDARAAAAECLALLDGQPRGPVTRHVVACHLADALTRLGRPAEARDLVHDELKFAEQHAPPFARTMTRLALLPMLASAELALGEHDLAHRTCDRFDQTLASVDQDQVRTASRYWLDYWCSICADTRSALAGVR